MKLISFFQVVFSALALTSANFASAQETSYPTRAVTIVVPWPAGGFTDRLGRMLADKLTASLGQSVVVENRPGASGTIGTEHVMRAKPDGYTILIASTDGMVKLLQQNGPDPVADLASIVMVTYQPVTLSVGPAFQGKTLADYVEAAKERPRQISYGSNGEGGATHLGMEIFAREASIKLNHIPYKGTSPALNDLLGGHVDSMIVSLQGINSQLKAGHARALAITSSKRSKTAPEVPTFSELGYPEFDLQLWYGVAAPAGTPDAIIEKLNTVLNTAIASPDIQQQLTTAAAVPMGGTPAEMLSFMQKEAERWNGIIKR